MVNDTMNENDKNNLPRSASSPRLAPNTNNRIESVSLYVILFCGSGSLKVAP